MKERQKTVTLSLSSKVQVSDTAVSFKMFVRVVLIGQFVLLFVHKKLENAGSIHQLSGDTKQNVPSLHSTMRSDCCERFGDYPPSLLADELTERDQCRHSLNGTMDLYIRGIRWGLFYYSFLTWEIEPSDTDQTVHETAFMEGIKQRQERAKQEREAAAQVDEN